MGITASKLEKALGPTFPENERYFGFENFGNTCYCNSVLQALYYCEPFRQEVLKERAQTEACQLVEGTPRAHSILQALGDLFHELSSQKKRTGVLSPRNFIIQLRKQNELFRGFMQQDAQEFLNYLLNEIDEHLLRNTQQKARKGIAQTVPATDAPKTFIRKIFQGSLTNEMKCLCCETVTSKEETFLDLSVDVEANSSITNCLRQFSATETLSCHNKFYCEICCSLQEAQKRLRIKSLPSTLIVHLKRFKYQEGVQRFNKLSHRVAFPLELRVPLQESPEPLFDLFAVIVHLGSGPNHGHYICIVKSQSNWLQFDDEEVDLIPEELIQRCFGCTKDVQHNIQTGYILFYQQREPHNSCIG